MKLSKDLIELFDNENTVTFKEFISKINHKSFGLFLVLLALPAAIPVPATGYGTPFGIVLCGLGIQLLLKKKHLWFPNFIQTKQVPITKGSKTLGTMIKFVSFFEVFLRPRLQFLTKGIFYRLLGLLIIVCGISMIIPLPLTNTVPAFGIFIIGLSLLEEDGLAAIIGSMAALTGIALTSALLYFIWRFGLEGTDILKDLIKNYISFL